MKKLILRIAVIVRNYLVFKKYDLQSRLKEKKIENEENADFVVSIASYPKRDHLLPAVFEALSYQTIKPKKWILVLSKEDYPDQKLPKHIFQLVRRGVEIIWTINNPYAVKKLLPILEKYPSLGVVTLDDDIIYHPSLISGLVNYKNKHQGTVFGYVGKSLLKRGQELNMFDREPQSASLDTPPEQVYLIGWGGIYYPPGSLDDRVLNMEAVHQIVPGRGSDIWFWAAAIAKDTKQISLGAPEDINLGIPIPQNNQTAPIDQPGHDILLQRFQMTIDYFGIREKLLKTLPEKK